MERRGEALSRMVGFRYTIPTYMSNIRLADGFYFVHKMYYNVVPIAVRHTCLLF